MFKSRAIFQPAENNEQGQAQRFRRIQKYSSRFKGFLDLLKVLLNILMIGNSL